MTKPLVSVVGAVYNGATYLAASLRSILGQADVDLECVIVDDGSTDESSAILADFARQDRRLRIIAQANAGLTRSLVHACAVARGQFLARHDFDDLSLPGRLARQVALLEADARLAFVSCWAHTIGPRDELLFETRRPVDPGEATELLTTRTGPYHGSVMMRRTAYEQAGGYRPAFRYAQDWDLWSRISAQGLLAYVPEFLYAYRVNGGSISANRKDQQDRLGNLAAACWQARRAGRSEEEYLQQAEQVSSERGGRGRSTGRHEYFIGRCLLARRDRRAGQYFWESVRHHPWHLRSWASLALTPVLCRTARADKSPAEVHP